jgi:3-hydroxyisobutyrate dehydrogenase-like beta-hydroxyacid dehydrogenase
MSAVERPRVGWIGIGRMGAELSGRLLDAGIDLAVWNRTRARAEPLAERGAAVVASAAELADRDVVFTTVAASADLEAVTMGEAGLFTAAERSPAILIDSSTVSAGASARVRAAGDARSTVLLAAPVSGNPAVVAAGNASLAVSGPRDAFETAAPLLALLGKSVTYVGAGDAARLVKIAHNAMLGIVSQTLAEVLVLAERSGVSRAAFLAFLNESVMGSTFTRYKTPALVSLELTPTFTPALLRKDLDLALDAAGDAGTTLPLTALTRERVQALIDGEMSDLDFAALLLLQAREAGLDLQPEALS